MDKMSKNIELLAAEFTKLKMENQQSSKGKGAHDQPNRNFHRNPNTFKRNDQPQVQILQRGRNTAEDQKINPPLQNAIFEDDEDDYETDDYIEDNINCVEADIDDSFLTQYDYEEALISEQFEPNANDDIIFQADGKGRYNLRSQTTAQKQSSSAAPPPKKMVVPPKQKTADPQKQQTVVPPRQQIQR